MKSTIRAGLCMGLSGLLGFLAWQSASKSREKDELTAMRTVGTAWMTSAIGSGISATPCTTSDWQALEGDALTAALDEEEVRAIGRHGLVVHVGCGGSRVRVTTAEQSIRWEDGFYVEASSDG